jgi:hypothetical protein
MTEINNWYSKVDKKNKDEGKICKHYKNHFILPNSRIAMIGGSGSGKTNALIELLHRAPETFYDIVIFTSNPDEPLLKQLKDQIPETQIITDILQIPTPSGKASEQKLIVFDDFITLKPKQMKIVEQWAISARKHGWSSIFMMQNYTSCPKTIIRQIEYFILYKLNDMFSINTIIKNHNVDGIPKDVIINAYIGSTSSKGNFFMLDLKNEDKKYRFRQNFTGLLTL